MRLGLSSFLKGGVLMSGYKIIMIILGILSVMISFGALVALICLEIANSPSFLRKLDKTKRPFLHVSFSLEMSLT